MSDDMARPIREIVWTRVLGRRSQQKFRWHHCLRWGIIPPDPWLLRKSYPEQDRSRHEARRHREPHPQFALEPVDTSASTTTTTSPTTSSQAVKANSYFNIIEEEDQADPLRLPDRR